MSALGVALILGQLADVATETRRATLSFSDRSEARLRSRPEGGNPAADIETLPTATFLLDGRRTDFFLGYGLRIAELDLFRSAELAVMHSASIGLGWAWTPQLHLDLVGTGSIGKQLTAVLGGKQNLGTPVAPGTGTATFAAPLDVIDVASYRVELGVSYKLSRTWDLFARGAYSGGQGLDAASRLVIPKYYGPSGEVAVGYTATVHDRLETRVLSSYIFTPTSGAQYLWSSVTEGWRHSYSKWTTSTVSVGVSWLVTRPTRDTPRNQSFVPTGEAWLAHTIPIAREQTLSLRVGARTGITFDPVLNAANPTVAVTGSATWAVHKFGTSATADTLTTIPTEPGQASARQLSFSALEFYDPLRWLHLETGVRGFVQDLPPAATAPGLVQPNAVQWVVFVGATILLLPTAL